MSTEEPAPTNAGEGARGPSTLEAAPPPLRAASATGKGPGSPGRILSRITRDRALRTALYVFLLTRVFVFAVMIIGGQIGRITTGSYDTSRGFDFHFDKTPVAQLLRENTQVADVNWYLGIAELGYHAGPFRVDEQRNWAFFPMFPMVWRAASRLTGEFMITGIFLSNLFFFGALILLYKLALTFGLDEKDARRTLFYLAIFPTSYFFSLPLTESLFLFLTLGSFFAARRERWWLAGLCGALASATRVTGVLLLPALFLIYWHTYGSFSLRDFLRRDFWKPRLLCLAILPAGLFAFMCFLHLHTGNAFAFKDILVTWGRTSGFFLNTLYQFVREPTLIGIPWDFRVLNFIFAMTAIVCGIVLLRRREWWPLACYTLMSVVVSLSSQILQSQGRYTMVLFPVFLVLAMAGRRERFDEVYRVVSLILFSLMLALFAAHHSVAMA
ncbi:MAG: hypothetical protein H7Z16_04165 [Pyrinomonadaceae bacterium]|nr:hypothetical protein [Pyrinomonadaceae bacterium]